jgi:hypothetical protein
VRYAVWAFGLSVAIVAALGIAIMMQQRHETKVLRTLGALCGRRIRFGVNVGRSQVAVVGPFLAVIESLDPNTRWITFAWVDFAPDDPDADLDGPATEMTSTLAENGLLADRIDWLEPEGEDRIRLN